MCAFASRNFNVDRGRPFGQWGLLGLAVSCEATLWLPPSFPPCDASLSFSFALSFGLPLCSARRMSKCFLRPRTARRWVKEWVCSGRKQTRVNSSSILVILWAIKHRAPRHIRLVLGYFHKVNESFDLWRIPNVIQTYINYFDSWFRKVSTITAPCCWPRHTRPTWVNIDSACRACRPFQLVWKVTNHQTFGLQTVQMKGKCFLYSLNSQIQSRGL